MKQGDGKDEKNVSRGLTYVGAGTLRKLVVSRPGSYTRHQKKKKEKRRM
jgi:hypothetical protein